MAKRKKGGFVARDFIVVTGIAAVAYFLFSSFKKGTTGNTTGGGTISPSGGTTTTGGGSLPPSGGTTTTGCNLLVNGFVNAGYVPPIDAANNIAGQPIMRDLTDAEKQAPLRMGAKGIHVMAFQIYLNAGMKKEDLIPVDGVFGNQTLTLMQKNVQKYGQAQQNLLDAYNAGQLSLLNNSIVSVNIGSQRRRFNAGFLPNCPQATNFYFGYVDDKWNTRFSLDESVINDY